MVLWVLRGHTLVLLGKSYGVGTCGSGTDRKRPTMNTQPNSVWRGVLSGPSGTHRSVAAAAPHYCGNRLASLLLPNVLEKLEEPVEGDAKG